MHRVRDVHKVVFVLGVALAAAGGLFLYQQIAVFGSLKEDISKLQRQGEEFMAEIDELEGEKKEHKEEIDRLKKREEELISQKEEVNRRVYDLARNGYAIKQPQASEAVELPESRYIRITAPNGGEALCLGEDYVVRWESDGISTVQIVLRGKEVGGSYLEFNHPANLNETGNPLDGTYVWKVGKVGESDGQDLVVSPGNGYVFFLFSYDGAVDVLQGVGDTSDAPFSIVQCEK
ncbi:MAG: hypothetical protein AAB567_03510 [Patescibacteria group bacterium]